MTSNPMMNFFRKFRLPLNRGKTNLHTFLRTHFQEFDDGLETLLSRQSEDKIFDQQIYRELEKDREVIRGFYRAILGTLKTYSNGKVLEAHRIFEGKMNEMQDHIAYLNLEGYRLFRIRTGDKELRFKRKDLFHLPFEKATSIRTTRYSIPGFPCLYFGGSAYSDTGLSLCWFECNLPNKFYWSEFETTNQTSPMLVIDFIWSPFLSATKANNYTYNKIFKSGLRNFVITYPLMATCSLIAVDKGDNHFIPEYIIPQMLLAWARNNNKCIGVAYPSSSEFDISRDHTAFNVAIPARQAIKRGHCRKLKREFRVSEPRFVDITHDIFKPLDKRLIDLRNCIHEQYQTLGFDPLQEMVSICNSFLLLHSKVVSEKNCDMFLIYDYIHNLNLFAEQLIKNRKYYFGNDKEIAWKKFLEFRETLRDYWNFIDKSVDTPRKPVFKFIYENN